MSNEMSGIYYLRNRIIAMAAPWIAAGDSFHRQPAAFHRPIFFNGLFTIFRAGRRIPAAGRKQWRNGAFVDADQKQQ